MALYMTEEQVRALCAKTGQRIPGLKPNAGLPAKPTTKPPPGPKTRRSKYNNIKTEVDGKLMDSKHEAEQYKVFQLQVRGGMYRAVLTQVPFLLPGGVVYKADFVTLNNDGTYTVFDAKSEATRKDKAYRIKNRQMKNCLNIEIKEI